VNASRFVLEARQLVGAPFRHQGRSPAGLDCLGLLLLAGSRAGVLHAGLERADYGRAPHAALEERLAYHCDPLEEVEPGAVLAIKWPGDVRAGHVAIAAPGGHMIHSYSAISARGMARGGRVVEHGYRGHWPRWTKSIWWIRGMTRG
jgi:cell wall-associated NlpC family hydrolase